MTIKNNKDNDNDNKPKDNIFEIMDGIIAQLNRTKKMFIIMTYSYDYSSNSICSYICIILARTVPILVSLVWLGIGIRQWFVLSKWSKKYERYKELQKRVDEKLDYDNDDEGKKISSSNKK